MATGNWHLGANSKYLDDLDFWIGNWHLEPRCQLDFILYINELCWIGNWHLGANSIYLDEWKDFFELATGNWHLGAKSILFYILTKYIELATGNWHLGAKSKYLAD